jgi:hypothetical protein
MKAMNLYLIIGSAIYIILEAVANIIYFDYENQPEKGSWRWFLFQYGRVGRALAGALSIVGVLI